jgi:hypothetical protein
MVVNAIPTQQQVTGSEIVNLGALIAEMQRAGQLQAQEQAGYYSAGSLGGGAFNPTLARDQLELQRQLGLGSLDLGRDQLGLDRELGFGNLALGRDQLNAAIAEAQRNYQLDLQRFGLDVATHNYNQRLGEATVRLEQLGLLSSLRGPSDYLAHNYTLNNMAAPPGQAVDPFQMTAGLNQQYTAPPMANVPQPAPTTMYNQQMQGGGSGSGNGYANPGVPQPPSAPTNAMAKPKAVAPPSPSGVAISGNPQADAQLKASGAWAGAPDPIKAEFDRISANMANTYANAKAKNPNFQLFAEGGQSPGGMAIVGDDESGQYTGNEELVMSKGPFQVLDHEDTLESGALPAAGIEGAGMGGMDGGQHMTKMIIEAFKLGQQESGMPPMDMPPPPVPVPGGGIPTAAKGGKFPKRAKGKKEREPTGNGGLHFRDDVRLDTSQIDDRRGRLSPVMARYLAEILAGREGVEQFNPMQDIPRAATGGNFGGMNPSAWQQSWGGGGNPNWQGGGGNSGGNDVQAQPMPNQNPAPQAPAQGGGGQGFFNFNVSSPQATQNAPFVQQTLGNMASPAFQQRGQDLGPFGAAPFSYTNYLSLLPSAREMLKGFIETPGAMGGLGSDWMDELERSRRAAATGVSLGPAQYSR